MHHVTSHPALARPTPPLRSRSSSAIGRASCYDLAVEVACAIRPEVIIVGEPHDPAGAFRSRGRPRAATERSSVRPSMIRDGGLAGPMTSRIDPGHGARRVGLSPRMHAG